VDQLRSSAIPDILNPFDTGAKTATATPSVSVLLRWWSSIPSPYPSRAIETQLISVGDPVA
jgi:hypothetical protein